MQTPPLGRQTPPVRHTPSGQVDTPGQADHPPGQTPPWPDTPWADTPEADMPPWSDTPTVQAYTPLGRQPPQQIATAAHGHCSRWYTPYWNSFWFTYLNITNALQQLHFPLIHFVPFVFLTLCFSYRTYIESEWCLKEFRDAHAHATGNGRKKFLVPVLCSDVTVGDLGTDFKFYMENHTYIEYKNLVKFFIFEVRIINDTRLFYLVLKNCTFRFFLFRLQTCVHEIYV